MLKLVRTTELCRFKMVVQQFILGFLTKFDKRILMAGAPPMPKESQHLPPPPPAGVGGGVGATAGAGVAVGALVGGTAEKVG